MLAAKMDLFLKWLDTHNEPNLKGMIQAMDSEACGNTGRLGNDCQGWQPHPYVEVILTTRSILTNPP